MTIYRNHVGHMTPLRTLQLFLVCFTAHSDGVAACSGNFCTFLYLVVFKVFYSVVPLYIGHFSHTWKPRCMPSETLSLLASRGLVPCIIYYSNGTTELCINVYFLFVLYHIHPPTPQCINCFLQVFNTKSYDSTGYPSPFFSSF